VHEKTFANTLYTVVLKRKNINTVSLFLLVYFPYMLNTVDCPEGTE